MFPIAVKGHMPFSPTYKERVAEAAAKGNRNSERRKSHRVKTNSCPTMENDKIEPPRQRSKSATYLDGSEEKETSTTLDFRSKLKKWFRAKKAKLKRKDSTPTPSTMEDPLDTGDDPTPPSSLKRSYSLNTPHHIPKLDAIIEEEEHSVKPKSGARGLGHTCKKRPNSFTIDRKSQTFQQMCHWSDSDGSCESIKDMLRV